MSCNRYQQDLSQCLDGRLPGARRAAVLAHVDACAECAVVWADMQAAQSLVFGLQDHRVGSTFRDDVWNRIHSGEGAPDILLQEPVSVGMKLRYGMVGAAAAAVILLGTFLITRTDSPNGLLPNGNESNSTESNITDVADLGQGEIDNPGESDTPPALPFGPQGPQDSRASQAEPTFASTALSPGHLASRTVKKVTEAADRLHLRREQILDGSMDRNGVLQRDVVTDVNTIEDGLTLIKYWKNRQLVHLEPASAACVTVAENTLRIFRSNANERAMVLVRSLDSCSLNALHDFKIVFRAQDLGQTRQLEMIKDMFVNVKYRGAVQRLGLIGFTDLEQLFESGGATGTFEWTQRSAGRMMKIRLKTEGGAQDSVRPQPKKQLRKRGNEGK